MVRPTLRLGQAALATTLLAGCSLGQPAPPPAPFPTGTATPAPTASPSPPPATESPIPPPTPTPLPTPDGAITRGPYLQSAASDSIVIVWETDRPLAGEVVFGRDGEYDQRLVSTAIGLRHEALLTGLEPGAEYGYWIASSGYPLSETGSFRTAPLPQDPSFTFVAIGDSQSLHPTHRLIAERILDLKPDFVVHTGDLVAHGSLPAEWDLFFEIERATLASVPLFPSLGNHEQNDRRYFEAFVLPGNERWYAFDWGNARFISLQIDAIMPFGKQSEQVQWLEATLAANTQPWLVVFFHVPPYDALPDDNMGDAVRINIVPLFERYQVDLVLNGHNHNYQRSIVNGITYIVTGGAGGELNYIESPDPDTEAYYNGHHLVQFAVEGDTLTGRALTVDGGVVDTFQLSSSLVPAP
jgi:Icc-related predicted phosphoesterase